MSHHLFLLSPSDTPLYSLTHYSSKPSQSTSSPLASNLPSWSTSAFAGTLTALSGASSASQTQHGQGGTVKIGGGQDRHVIQMIANASLDAIEEVMRKESVMSVAPVSYLKSVDKFNEWTVSAFVTPGNMKFVLLHESRNDDGIKAFFNDVWELYVKVSCTASLQGCPEGRSRHWAADDAEPVPYGPYANPECCVRCARASECEEALVGGRRHGRTQKSGGLLEPSVRVTCAEAIVSPPRSRRGVPVGFVRRVAEERLACDMDGRDAGAGAGGRGPWWDGDSWLGRQLAEAGSEIFTVVVSLPQTSLVALFSRLSLCLSVSLSVSLQLLGYISLYLFTYAPASFSVGHPTLIARPALLFSQSQQLVCKTCSHIAHLSKVLRREIDVFILPPRFSPRPPNQPQPGREFSRACLNLLA
ncbi:hypothetical protein NUW54_g13077 [Trametes sanguinea]|uniref:Uncharacterized protein n=1 Tax=Trametes sanguinea TaxID=158606 RepID=A0ACC1MPK3_9APHY|nr:hypothetical protein NUW54_g13077 [Trametes sanguinea]